MKDVLTYTGYRQYIADYYADKKAKSAFTWQEFARAAGFSSPVYLKYVSEGQFNLSEAAVERVASAMHLADFEREYFREMVRFDHAKTDKAKKESFQKLMAMAESRKAKIIEADAFRYFDSWKIRYFANWRPRCREQSPWRLLRHAALKSAPPK